MGMCYVVSKTEYKKSLVRSHLDKHVMKPFLLHSNLMLSAHVVLQGSH